MKILQKLVLLAAIIVIILAYGTVAFAAAAAETAEVAGTTETAPGPSPITRGEAFASVAEESNMLGKVIGPITQSFDENSPLFDDHDCEIKPGFITMATFYYWGQEIGLIYGTGSNKFEPNRPITREEWATLWMRYMAIVQGVDFGPTPSEAELQAVLGDADISEWAREHYYNAIKHGFMTEVGDPKGSVYYEAYTQFHSGNFYYNYNKP
jgi:hypothetical protein